MDPKCLPCHRGHGNGRTLVFGTVDCQHPRLLPKLQLRPQAWIRFLKVRLEPPVSILERLGLLAFSPCRRFVFAAACCRPPGNQPGLLAVHPLSQREAGAWKICLSVSLLSVVPWRAVCQHRSGMDQKCLPFHRGHGNWHNLVFRTVGFQHHRLLKLQPDLSTC